LTPISKKRNIYAERALVSFPFMTSCAYAQITRIRCPRAFLLTGFTYRGVASYTFTPLARSPEDLRYAGSKQIAQPARYYAVLRDL
jgi:hypothetical protein